MNVLPPVNKQELLDRINKLTGITLQQLAHQMNFEIPTEMRHAKGWTGRLLEAALGANAASAPKPDFINLGIELKTVPINQTGKPQESTYICTVQLDHKLLSSWERSLVKHKLTKVLWVPIEATKTTPLSLRRIGNSILWQPNENQERQLREDWQELSDMIAMGDLDKISSSMGKYLQIRPKASNARSLTQDKNQIGFKKLTLPRGFYLRSAFTHSIILPS